MLNSSIHRQHITSLLLKIYAHPFLGSALGFKGGTAAYLFYGLPRFSVDLDFDILPALISEPETKTNIVQALTALVGTQYEIVDQSTKFYTLFWLLSYQKGSTHIKIEVSTRKFGSSYEQKAFYGVTLQVMSFSDVMAHKLVAIVDRKTPANRDLFDAHYFLSLPESVNINYDLIKERLNLTPKSFYGHLLKHLQTRDRKKIIDGLGELLTQSQKDWAKAKLFDELIELVKMKHDSF